jgi:hypothetical protein
MAWCLCTRQGVEIVIELQLTMPKSDSHTAQRIAGFRNIVDLAFKLGTSANEDGYKEKEKANIDVPKSVDARVTRFLEKLELSVGLKCGDAAVLDELGADFTEILALLTGGSLFASML